MGGNENENAEGERKEMLVEQELRTEPHLELRLIEGESCVFLKVCRTLKSVIYEKLDAAVQMQRRPSRRGCASMKRMFSDADFMRTSAAPHPQPAASSTVAPFS
uniref:Uncharacterized protein n=1 Tax=Erythrolobus madagascarensis TaxID=708628 RepID=A0A7S0T5Z4_9RHOD